MSDRDLQLETREARRVQRFPLTMSRWQNVLGLVHWIERELEEGGIV